MASLDITLPDGTRKTSEALLAPWIKRAEAARKARRQYEKQWMLNQAFAGGQQWIKYSQREHRYLEDPRRKAQGRSMQESDVLTQYLWTAIGKLAADDFRPEMLFSRGDEEAALYAKQANTAFGWGWDEEWRGDEKLLDLLQTLAVLGTGAIRCRYDRSKGNLIGDVPHVDGKPILDPEQARAHVAEAKYYGEQIDLRPLREGAVSWELLTPWNLLPPPGIERAEDFPWEIIVRPVHTEELKAAYGDRAAGVAEDAIEATSLLGMKDLPTQGAAGQGTESPAKLEDHALVYTGTQRPTADFPKGLKIVWAGNDGHLLDVTPQLDYQEQPYGPRSGITYFRYWPVKGRFFGRALIEPGIGPQRRRNKRSSQIDEIIDKGLPKVFAEEGSIDTDRFTGTPLEVVEVKAGASMPKPDGGIAPGAWMNADVDQCDTDIEKALGLHGVSVGAEAPSGAPYALMALASENDAVKLDPIAKLWKLGVADVSRDTFEAMRQWPDGKQLMIAGEDDELQVVTFERATLPRAFYVRPAKGGTLPRSQGAEIQKISDLWQAALVAGAVPANPAVWLEWYKTSLDSGKAEELPRMADGSDQRHKAALENIVMVRTGQVVPVAPYDDAAVHVEEHTVEIEQLSAAAQLGDQHAAAAAQVIDQHRQLHLQQAALNAATNTAAAPAGPPAPPQFGGAPGPPAPPQP